MTEHATGTGRGKLILFGEHAVVYGTPAIVAGLDDGARAEVELTDRGEHALRFDSSADDRGLEEADFRRARDAFEAILADFDLGERSVRASVDVDVPVGVGLGSSAAFSAALARAVASAVGQPDRVDDAVASGEAVFHGDPSGIDQLAALEGGLRFYHRREGGAEPAPSIDAPAIKIGVCVADEPAETGDMVDQVGELADREPSLFERIRILVGDTARTASGALEEGDRQRVGRLMDINHGALVSLGVSTEALDRACRVAREAGAYGAKLTGAGGGGCVCAILPTDGEEVLEAWRREGWRAFRVELGGSND